MITREFRYCTGCCWFISCFTDCAHELTIESPVGTPIGYIVQKYDHRIIKVHIFVYLYILIF